jgi:uncharacterized membrane protein
MRKSDKKNLCEQTKKMALKLVSLSAMNGIIFTKLHPLWIPLGNSYIIYVLQYYFNIMFTKVIVSIESWSQKTKPYK